MNDNIRYLEKKNQTSHPLEYTNPHLPPLVKVDLDKKGNLTFDHVQLQDLEQKGLMNVQRIKSYDKLDQLSGFSLKMQDDRQELLSKIAELESQLDQLNEQEE